MKKLTTFQMTRFTYNIHIVFLNLCDDYLAVWQSLLNVVASKESISISLDRGKAEEAKKDF